MAFLEGGRDEDEVLLKNMNLFVRCWKNIIRSYKIRSFGAPAYVLYMIYGQNYYYITPNYIFPTTHK